MGKVNLDYSNIPANALNQLDNAINYLNDVIRYLQQNSIPNDFYRKNTFSTCLSSLKNQRDKLVDIKSWVVNSNKNYDSMIEKLEEQAFQLPTYKLKKRRTIV